MACGTRHSIYRHDGWDTKDCAPGSECPACLREELERVRSDLAACEAERKRERIGHLRRMGETSERFGVHMIAEATPHIDSHPYYLSDVQQGERLRRFAAACRAAIERERGA